MRLTARSAAVVFGAALLLASAGAYAHISIPEPAYAGTNQVITFNVGHGCAGADTVGIEVQIPSGVTSVRGLPNFFGYADVKTDASGTVTSVVWTKAENRPGDDQYYQVQIRIKVPETPFETLYFPTVQHCRSADGEESTSEWTSTANPVPEGEEPAPALRIMPPRKPGWNKYAAPKEITDLSMFDDAQIVWVDDAAYSSNEATASMIAAEEGVSELTTIPAGAEIWVKY